MECEDIKENINVGLLKHFRTLVYLVMIKLLTITEARKQQLDEVCSERYNKMLDDLCDEAEAADVNDMHPPNQFVSGTFDVSGVPAVVIICLSPLIKQAFLKEMRLM